MHKSFVPLSTQFWGGVALTLLAAAGCAIRRTARVDSSQLPPPPREASLAELVADINAQSQAIRTLVATVDFEPKAGKKYHDVKGFILLQKPATIRVIGQAPVVGTKIFDMVSTGEEFRLYIPPKRKFIVGKTASCRPTKNSLESLRPQHILDALLVPALDSAQEKYVRTETREGRRRYYVVDILGLQNDGDGNANLKRKVWFDRSDLEIARQQIYGPHDSYLQDVQYSGYQDFQGLRYPTRIQVNRPVEKYSLSITILKATFNQPIAPEKFELKKPESAHLLELSAAPGWEHPRGQ